MMLMLMLMLVLVLFALFFRPVGFDYRSKIEYPRWRRSWDWALLLLVHPGAILPADGHYSHPLLMLVMLGASGGFVHGVGFRPELRAWRVLFGPLRAWPLLTGYVLLLKAQAGI